MALDFGLAAGTPIAAGAGDTAANALGAGIVKAGMLFDVAGTASVFAGCTDRFVADEENQALLTMRSVLPGLWNPLAYIGGGGLALRWFRDQFFNAAQGVSQPAQDDLYDRMSAMAASAPVGCDGLFFSPHLGGRICPAAPGMRGAWVGFSWGHTQAHFFRAILESVAFEYAYYLSILRGLLPDLKLLQARVAGGGARSLTWNQIKSDVLGVPYQPLMRSELGTWGSALIAGHAVGLIANLEETAYSMAGGGGQMVQPSAENLEAYKPFTDQYIAWQHTLHQAFSQLPVE